MRPLLALLASVSTAVGALPTEAYAAPSFTYHGFRIDTTAIDGSPEEAALMAGVRAQVDIVEDVGLTADTLAFLRRYVIHLSQGPGGGHFGRDGVSINLTPNVDDRPILLHEEMHAYQHGRLAGGLGNTALRRFFGHAHLRGLWPVGSYMLSNVGEFFAMTASVELHGHAARPPFTRAALETRQPAYAAWLRANVR